MSTSDLPMCNQLTAPAAAMTALFAIASLHERLQTGRTEGGGLAASWSLSEEVSSTINPELQDEEGAIA